MSRVSFSFPGGGLPAEELVYTDLKSENPELHHVPLQEGTNEIDLPKDGLHVLGLVSRSSVSGSILSSRGIGSAISTLGNISIVSNGLDSMPLSNDSEDLVDLGELEFSDGSYGSGLSGAAVSDLLGYDPASLEGMGLFDEALIKFLNPDINQDGIYDAEQDLDWSFILVVDYDIDNALLNYDSITLPVADFSYNGFRILIRLKDPRGLVSPVQGGDAHLTLPQTVQNTSTSLDVDTLSTATEINTEEGLVEFWFSLDRGYDPLPPYTGNYELSFNGNTLYFQNMDFIKPAENHEGFVFPVVKPIINSSGKYQTVYWKWMQIRDGGYFTAGADLVKLVVPILYFYFYDSNGEMQALQPEHFGKDYSVGGILNLTGYDLWRWNDNPGDVNYNYLPTDWWDRATCDYSLRFRHIVN